MDEQYVKHQKEYKKPQIVDRLPQRVSLNSGKFESVEVANVGNIDYYDGSKRLNLDTQLSVCHTLEKTECLRKNECGWCGSSNSCVNGTNLGPAGPCLSGTYLYSSQNKSN